MIGKIKLLDFNSLFLLILFSLIINSLIFNNLLIVSTFLIFFLISLLTTKYGLEIIKKLNLLQNIRDEVASQHFSKKNTPTMGGIFIILPFLLLLLIINNRLNSIGITLLFFCSLGFFLIGLLDDYLSIIQKKKYRVEIQ